MLRFFVIFIFAFSYALVSTAVEAKRFHTERWYQENHCKGIIEHRLQDGTRVDCLVGGYAIEYDFIPKWAESGFQSLHYASSTGLHAGIVLIVERPKDCKHLPKIKNVIKDYWLPIDIELIAPDGAGGIKTISCEE